MDWIARKLPERDRPWAVVGMSTNQRPIVAANVAAMARGVERGMSLTQAQAVCSELSHREHDAARDALALTALARWMTRFSPLVCPVFEDHTIFLDVKGCRRVFGGLDRILRQISGTMRRWRLTARSAIGPNPGAAWALAQFGASNHLMVEEAANLEEILSPLPVTGLRIDPACAEDLHHLGIERIGELVALPRSSLPARFGKELLLRLDEAMGRTPEPLNFLGHESPVRVREDFEGPLSAPESIEAALDRLIARMVAELGVRGAGVRRLEADFFRPYATAIHRSILLSRPTRDGKKILRLLRCAMEGIGEEQKARRHQGTKSRRGERAYCLFPPAGFVGIRLEAAVMEKLVDEQFNLLEQAERTGQVELDELIERLTLRLGAEGLVRAELVESHIPEKATRKRPEAKRMMEAGAKAAGKGLAKRAEVTASARPLQLLEVPVEIGVIATLSPDGDGRPGSLIRDGTERAVTHATGPERISGQWWEGQTKTRDYFEVEDDRGRRFWIFRVMETTRWFLQGEF
jgi:protein ImuB